MDFENVYGHGDVDLVTPIMKWKKIEWKEGEVWKDL